MSDIVRGKVPVRATRVSDVIRARVMIRVRVGQVRVRSGAIAGDIQV